ncbi:MAG: 1-acyl-sn-glycerol-3-phosphate acyltransferase, partial [Lachnospiraceae bacterium]|nr:1-acyl-sn-glycerol-3-phosphate acyltransferase [Lachnospiraceae bacterium]
NMIKSASFIKTRVFGAEKLPSEGGYIMYSNHQGKYDALGIFYAHDKPCSVVMDEKKSHMVLTRQIMSLCDGKTLVLNDPRSGLKTILEMAEEAEMGRKFLIFPEGGYHHNHNSLQDFKPGCFKASLKSKTPIVPIALVDSYRAYEGFAFGFITTQVHFLDPIPYEEYKDMKTPEIAEMVRGRIEAKINEVLEQRKARRKV